MRLERVETKDKKKAQYILPFEVIRIIRRRAGKHYKTQSKYIADLVYAEDVEALDTATCFMKKPVDNIPKEADDV